MVSLYYLLLDAISILVKKTFFLKNKIGRSLFLSPRDKSLGVGTIMLLSTGSDI